MSLQRQDVDKLLAPALVDGLRDVAVGEVRSRRDACKHVEDLVSYLRRVIQGQIDLVNAEIALRAGGARGDAGALVQNLAGILAGPPSGPGSGQRPVGAVHNMSALAEMFDEPSDMTPDEIAAALAPDLVETLFPGGSLPGANLGSFSDGELVELAEKLNNQEQELSVQRHTLHERIDLLQATIVERYKSGAADIDSLLADSGDEPGQGVEGS